MTNKLIVLAGVLDIMRGYGDSVDNTVEENSSIFSLIRMRWFAISKGMWAVKLCTNKIFQLLTGAAG